MAKLVLVIFAVFLIGAHGQENTTTVAPPEPTTITEPPTTTPTTTATTTTTPAPPTPPTPAPTPAPTTPPTTAAPPTPTPHPSPDEYYRVTENNVTCVIYGGDVSFSVSYKQASGKMATAVVKVPQPGKEDASSTGTCDAASDSGLQFVNITWGPTNKVSSFQLQFNMTTSGSKWMLISIDADLYIDEATFHNATDAGQYLTLSGEFPGLSNVAVDTNSSLTCRAAVDSKNFTTLVNGTSTQGYTVTGSAIGMKMQAFNFIPNMKDLQQGMRCEADITSDLVPIAVGCALAGLVLLVLISYLVGRRRRAAAYQSV